MRALDESDVLPSLVQRLERLSDSSARQWGTMTCQQMLVHVAGAMESVCAGERFSGKTGKPSRLIKFIALKAPVAWPRGLPSGGDPASVEVDGAQFAEARSRTIRALEAMAAADGSSFTPIHPAFGPMTRKEWYRWAARHLDHHLRQFGV